MLNEIKEKYDEILCVIVIYTSGSLLVTRLIKIEKNET